MRLTVTAAMLFMFLSMLLTGFIFDSPTTSKAPSFNSTSTISGTITFKGKSPKLRKIKMDADPGCLVKHSESVFSQALVMGKNNTMANIFVRVKSGLAKKKYDAPAEPVVLDQKGCMYYPHVFGIMAGQP